MNLQDVKTAAVVLNWNQSLMTLDCVQTLRKQTRPIDLMIVVDNGSRLEQRAILDGLDNGVRRIQLQANRGFAGGMNAGIRAALESGVSYVWLMNNDAFPEPDCLAALVSAMETDATLGAVTPRIVRSDGSEEHAGGRYDFTTDHNTIFTSLEFSKPDTGTGYWVNGPAPLVRSKALTEAGLFDERIFAYWEEIELCFRVAKCGFRFRAVPEVFVTHLGSVSTGGSGSAFSQYMYIRNRLHVFRWHRPVNGNGIMMRVVIRNELHRAARYQRQGEFAKAQTVIQAVAAAILREYGPPRMFGRAKGLTRIIAERQAQAFIWFDNCIAWLRSQRTGTSR